MMPALQHIVNLGDSVPWGQGLANEDKYDVLVKKALAPDATLDRRAHSGATIGSTLIEFGPADGEVPVALPAILDQCRNFDKSPETVDLLLLNGGINDVDIRTILNPLFPAPVLSALTRAHCHDAMLDLLRAASVRFSKTTCRIVLTGYYPILSDQSHFPSILDFLEIHGIAPPSFLEENLILKAVIARCQQFFEESTASFRQAVADAGDRRIVYVDSGFTGDNAAFAPHAMLWGLNDNPELSPEDEVAAQRHAACNVTFNELQILEREQCYRASAGHPNPAGARQYANQIVAALNRA